MISVFSQMAAINQFLELVGEIDDIFDKNSGPICYQMRKICFLYLYIIKKYTGGVI
jgi:hypothetical protein